MNTDDTTTNTEAVTGTVDIVLAGARGHGRWHLENIR